MDMEISADADSVTRHTKLPMLYIPGKSRLIYMTGVLLSNVRDAGDSIRSRMGLINVDSSTPTTIANGTYFETDGIALFLADTTLLSPGQSTALVTQASWNIDTFTSGSLILSTTSP